MANFISTATGNFSSASSWATCDSASAQTARTASYPTTPTGSGATANTTTTTTSNVFTPSFTPAAATCDGLLLYIGRNATGSSGTFTVGLSTDFVNLLTNQQVTVNVSDIPFCNAVSNSATTLIGTWMFFKFPSTVTFSGSTAYKLGVVSSVSGSVNVFRGSATAGDWERLLRLTATGSPGSGDVTFIVGEWTSAATVTARTITMDVTTATATTFGKMDIGVSGTMTYGTTGSTNYRLKIGQASTNGHLDIWSGGTLNIGTSGTPMPSTSTALLEFESASQTASTTMYGLNVNNGGTLTTFGNSITQSALLAADASASATSLTTNVSTGWKSGDSIGIASTSTTQSQSEKKALTADAVTTTLTIAALTNAHSGTSPTQGELINLTRNVKIAGLAAGTPGYVFADAGATINCSHTEFTFLGNSSTPTTGFTLRTNPTATPAGSAAFTGCALHDAGTSAYGFYLDALSGTTPNGPVDSVSFTNCNIYLTNNTGINVVNVAASPNGNSISLTNVIGINCTTAMMATQTARVNVTNCTAAGNVSLGFSFLDNTTAGQTIVAGTFTGNTAHSNGGNGITSTTTIANLNWSSLTLWRNSGAGMNFSAGTTALSDSLISQVTAFGNTSQGINMDVAHQNVVWDRLTFNGGATNVQPVGITFASTYSGLNVWIMNSTFGATTNHTTADWNIAAANMYMNLFCNNVSLASTTQINNVTTNLRPSGRIGITRFGQTSGQHKTFWSYGTTTSDNVLFKTAAPSEKLMPTAVPTTGRLKMEASPKRAALNNGQTTTVSVWVRQSVVGDGTAYAGSFPTLVLKANPGAGILTDTVLATASAAGQGAFELLSATTSAVSDDCVLEFTVQCNGATAGAFINVDDWSVT